MEDFEATTAVCNRYTTRICGPRGNGHGGMVRTGAVGEGHGEDGQDGGWVWGRGMDGREGEPASISSCRIVEC